MRRVLLFVVVVAVCLAQTATPPAPVSPPAVSAYYRLAGQAHSPDEGKTTGPYDQYKWTDVDAPLTFTFDATGTPHIGVTLPAPAPPPATSRQCSFSLGNGVDTLQAAAYPVPVPGPYPVLQGGPYPAINAFMGCPNNTGVPWTVTGIHCWSDNIGLSSTVDVLNNAGTSFMLLPLLCGAVQSNGGTVGTLNVGQVPLWPANTTLAPGDAFNFKFVSDGITMAFRVTVDYQ